VARFLIYRFIRKERCRRRGGRVNNKTWRIKMMLLKRLEDLFAGAAMAEAGEYDTAVRIAGLEKRRFTVVRTLEPGNEIEDMLAGAAMAEGGEFDAAVKIAGVDSKPGVRGKTTEPLCGEDCEGLTPPPVRA
jgi:hypothetical protein